MKPLGYGPSGIVGRTRREPFPGNFWIQLRAIISLPFLLWTALWLAIGTGPWNFTFDGGITDWSNDVRASFPLVALAIAAVGLASSKRQHRATTVEMGFLLYGLVMFGSTLPVDPWFPSAYWAFAFLATLAVTQLALTGNDPMETARQLNWISWLMATVMLVVLIIFARDTLFEEGALSGYAISNKVPTFNGMAMARSSGLSRLAAVPATIALAYIFRGQWRTRLIAAIVFAGAFYIIWFMQSRGSLFAFLGAFLFTLFLGERIARRIGFALCIAVLLFWLAGSQSGGVLEDLWQHATRETGAEGFQTMSGRPEIWQNAFHAVQQAPFIGYGAQGDRRILGQMGGETNAQSALIYALLSTGVIGATFFLLAMLAAWWNLVRLLSLRRRLPQTDQLFVTIAGAMLVFNTLRSIPENNAALFSVDLLVQYPAMVYLAVLTRKAKLDLRTLKHPIRQLTPVTRQFAYSRPDHWPR